jgi:hypothetical protein
LADTVLVQVTQAPLTTSLAAVSIQPPSGDSAKAVVVAANVIGNKTLIAYATTVSGDTVANPLVYYTSSDPTIATIDRTKGVIHGNVPGHVTFYATTTMYGVTRLDSLPYVIGYPIDGIISAAARTPVGSVEQILAFSPPEITVGVGAIVAWSNQVAQPIDVVFDNSTEVQPASYEFFGLTTIPASGGGNIASFQGDTTGGVVAKLISQIRARSFPVAGTYHFHSELYHTTGTIVVLP